MAEISSKARKALPASSFALPEKRAYPIDTAARTRNAAARLEQNKASLSPQEYSRAKRAIARAAKRFGIESEYNAREMDMGPDDVHTPAAGGAPKSKIRRGLAIAIDHPLHGKFEIRQMRAVELDEALCLADAKGKRVWIQLAKVGHWAGHRAGAFQLGPREFGEIVANFKATENHRVPIDFEHASETDPSEGSIPTAGAPAQGWILDLDNRGEAGLWGLVEWGETAREYIKTGQYRYISPAIRFGARDRVTGKEIGARLTSAGLTNQPFLDGMKPLAASDGMAARLAEPDQYMPHIRAALRLSPLASAIECATECARLRDMCEMADHPRGVHQGVDLSGYVDGLRACAGAMPHDASYEDLFDVVEEMIEAAIARHEAEYHGVDASDDAPESASAMKARDEEEHHMADSDKNVDPKHAATVVALGAANEKVEKLEEEVETLKKQAASAAKDHRATLSDRDAKVRDLTEKLARFEEQEVRGEVETAFSTYKDVKKLSDRDLDALLEFRKAAPEAFRAMYPKIDPAKAHLMRDITVQRGGDPPPKREEPKDIVALAAELRVKDPTLIALAAKGPDGQAEAWDQSFILADKQIRKSRAA